MRIIVAVVLMACALPSLSIAQTVIERFDHLPAQTIEWGQPLALEHFDLEVASAGRAGAIHPAGADDDLASGMALGIAEGHSLSTMHLYFRKAWRRVDITFVVPPSDSPVYSVTTLYGATEHPYSMTLQHSAAGHRARISLSQPVGAPFTSLMLHLQRGAYVDNVELR